MQVDPVLEQLDWFFTTNEWTIIAYPNTLVKPLAKDTSDHIPCVVNIATKIPKAQFFRFENYWVDHRDFMEIVRASWEAPCYCQDSAKLLTAKFKSLRSCLKHWSKTFCQLNILIQNCKLVTYLMDDLEDQRALSIPEWNFRNIVKIHKAKLLHYKQEYWKKRSTIRWVEFGDDNNKLFHALATEQYRKNTITKLTTADERIVTNHHAQEVVL